MRTRRFFTKLGSAQALHFPLTMKAFLLVWLGLIPAGIARGDLPTLFVSQPGRIVRLVDQNGDGDYLDFGENTVYAFSLPTGIGALVVQADRLFVVDAASASIYLVRDLNGDGDALDAGEVVLFAQITGPGQPSLAGLAAAPDGGLFSVETTTGTLYHFLDSNADGDALDFGESLPVAGGFTNPTWVAARPDGALLLAQQSSLAPAMILQDRNADGDYFDFAESISYVENNLAGTQIASPETRIAFLLRPVDGRVMRLHDLTDDDDALDFGEVAIFAEKLTALSAMAAANADELFVATADAAATIYRIADLNHDGDALDFAEVAVVATGLAQVAALAAPTNSTTCLAGDLDANGAVTLADVPPFVNAILGQTMPELCRADTNHDALVNAKDISRFVRLLVP